MPIFITLHVGTKSSPNFTWTNLEQKGKPIALLFDEKYPFSSLFIFLQKDGPNFTFANFEQKDNPIALLLDKNYQFSSLSKLPQKVVQNFFQSIPSLQPYFLAKIRPFSALFTPKSKSVKLIFGQNWAKYQGYSLTFWAKFAHFRHFSLQNQNLWNWFLVKIGQNTKAIALLFGQNSPIFGTFHSKIKICEIDFWSKLGKIPRL